MSNMSDPTGKTKCGKTDDAENGVQAMNDTIQFNKYT